MINIEAITGSVKCKFYDGTHDDDRNTKRNIKKIYEVLKEKEDHYKVYLREEMPEYYHFNDNPFITPIVITADLGWSLCTNKSLTGLEEKRKSWLRQ